jgi:hypothetical protein
MSASFDIRKAKAAVASIDPNHPKAAEQIKQALLAVVKALERLDREKADEE